MSASSSDAYAGVGAGGLIEDLFDVQAHDVRRRVRHPFEGLREAGRERHLADGCHLRRAEACLERGRLLARAAEPLTAALDLHGLAARLRAEGEREPAVVGEVRAKG